MVAAAKQKHWNKLILWRLWLTYSSKWLMHIKLCSSFKLALWLFIIFVVVKVNLWGFVIYKYSVFSSFNCIRKSSIWSQPSVVYSDVVCMEERSMFPVEYRVYSHISQFVWVGKKGVPSSNSTCTCVIFPTSWREDVFSHPWHTTQLCDYRIQSNNWIRVWIKSSHCCLLIHYYSINNN